MRVVRVGQWASGFDSTIGMRHSTRPAMALHHRRWLAAEACDLAQGRPGLKTRLRAAATKPASAGWVRCNGAGYPNSHHADSNPNPRRRVSWPQPLAGISIPVLRITGSPSPPSHPPTRTTRTTRTPSHIPRMQRIQVHAHRAIGGGGDVRVHLFGRAHPGDGDAEEGVGEDERQGRAVPIDRLLHLWRDHP